MNPLEKSLYYFAKSCQANQLLVEDWFNTAIIKLASQGGQSVQSTSANGIMVSFASGLTLSDWVSSLTNVLERLNSPATVQNKSVLAFR